MTNLPDIFAEAKDRYDVLSMWVALGIPGEPKIGDNFSPFREEKRPSFSIYEGGQKWKDHGTGQGGDCIELAKVYRGFNGPDLREFLMERLGIGFPDRGARVSLKAFTPAPKSPEPPKVIQWPCELGTGTEETWKRFAELRGLSYAGVWTMVEAGVLRFGIVDGHKCFVLTDDERRAAEIRRLDGETFSNGQKAYPLKGVDKSWPVGAKLIARRESWAFSEGASDFLHLFDLYVQYRKAGGQWVFTPMGLLGAGIKHLVPEIMRKAHGRTAVLIPDGDDSGARMGEHWSEQFSKAGADVETMKMPPGKDLRDMCLAGEIRPEDIFDE
jgi:hypothetical protein